MSTLLEVSNLRVRFAGDVAAVRDVSFTLDRGQSLAIVGESGSGKSTIGMSLVGLLQPPEASGSVRVDGVELLGASPHVLRTVRWDSVAIALQGTPLNPVATVGSQVAEPLRVRRRLGAKDAWRRAKALAEEAQLDPALLERYPHQLSGGERRRATLAMVLALDPALVILDEPTAGLDRVTCRRLVESIRELAGARGFGLVVISHDLPDAAQLATRCMVLYAGEAMEVGPTSAIMRAPAHPYSWALVNAYPVMTTTKDLRPIRGRAPDARAVPDGCPFEPRCTQAEAVCQESHPPLLPIADRRVACHFGGLKTSLSARGVSKAFRVGQRRVTALCDVSLDLREGESVGIIGPSGSGKSTLALILSGHLAADDGEVTVHGSPVSTSWRGAARRLRRRIQLVMQDPAEALSPRLTVRELVREPLDVSRTGDRRTRHHAVERALEGVGLPGSGAFLHARTHQLSGGQLQRVALARALVLEPKILVADEPTAMLDASEQARLLVVLRERQVEMGLSLVLISHDLALVRKVTDRIVVLDAGRVVEEGASQVVATTPSSPTAQALLAAAPAFEPIEAVAVAVSS